MDSMDNFRERFEALEQQTEQLKNQTQALEAHTRMVERRLRVWRGIACGLLLLGLMSMPLPSGTAQEEYPAKGRRGLLQRIEDLEYKLQYVTGGDDEVVITGANLRIVNGLGTTETTNGLGNLIVGYNESRQICPPPIVPCTDTRTGSHNVVVGKEHNFSSFGGLVVGLFNEISGQFASVSGGNGNKARSQASSISGGATNEASGILASVSGGGNNTASGFQSSVSGGGESTASGESASVSGGRANTASGNFASVSGGGGLLRGNTASGQISSVSGGENNTASGTSSSVSGGSNRSAPGTENWAAGPLFADN